MTVKHKPLAEVTQRAIEILCRELGAADTIRFINQFTNGHGDYTLERDALFAGESLDQMIADIIAAKPGERLSSQEAEVKPYDCVSSGCAFASLGITVQHLRRKDQASSDPEDVYRVGQGDFPRVPSAIVKCSNPARPR